MDRNFDNDRQDKKENKLHEEEERELREGQELYEMTQSAGFRVLKGWLETSAYHSWVDPRGMNKEEWEFAELNAYHAANNAKELMEAIAKSISRSEYLAKVKSGEVERKQFRL
jgi:hypothetical protein